MAFQIKIFTFNDFQENTYVLYDETKQCIIVDPGCKNNKEQNILSSFITEHGLIPIMLVNTHCHIDHVLGNAWVSQQYDLGLYAHEMEKATLHMQPLVAQMYGMPYEESPQITGLLHEGELIHVGSTYWKILFVPGHAPGHICLYNEGSHTLIAGDTLFEGSIGRTDLPGGHHDTLIRRIQSELFTLPDETVVYPGHGGSTTIGVEKSTNPFF